MAIMETETRIVGPYVGTGLLKEYSLGDMAVLNVEDLVVLKTTVAGQEEKLVHVTDYSVALNDDQLKNPGGNLSLATELPEDELLTLTTDLDLILEQEITNTGGWLPSILNILHARIYIVLQQLAGKLSRSLRFPISDGSVNTELPVRSLRKGKAIVCDPETGDVTISDDDYKDQVAAVTEQANTASSSAATAVSAATVASNHAVDANAFRLAAQEAAVAAQSNVISDPMKSVCGAASLADARTALGALSSVQAGLGAEVDATDPANPIVSAKVKLDVAQTFSKAQRTSSTALTSASNNVAIDFALNNDFTHTLTENTTLADPTNLVAGQKGRIFLTQGSTARTVAFGSKWKFAGGTVPEVSTDAAAIDCLYYDVLSPTVIAANLVKGFA